MTSQVEDICQRAMTAWYGAIEGEGEDDLDTVLIPFAEELRPLVYDFNFDDARDMDFRLFGVRGEFWASSFGEPGIGDIVNNVGGEKCILTGRVADRGLLTLDLIPV